MKILWHSNAPHAPSGYGNQTKLFAPRVRDLGHDVAISAYYGVRGCHSMWQDMHVYPAVADSFGNDILPAHAVHHFGGTSLADGVVVTLMDVWVLNPALFDKAHAAAWVPIDHDPVPPRTVQWFEHAPSVLPIAMTRFGQRQLEAALPGRQVAYVPHGVETGVFRPYDETKRADVRRQFGVDDDTFVVGMVAANQGNPPRKSFGEAIQGFAKWLKAKPDRKALLYLHTERDGKFEGVNLLPLLKACGLSPDHVRFVDQYRYTTALLGDEYMVDAYNAMDVMLLPSMGEGFGIPLIEAQACGVPVITSAHTACGEVGQVGWHVGGQRYWTPQESWQFIPNVDEIAMSLEDASRGMAYRKRGAARDFAMGYDADHVTRTYWGEVLALLEAQLAHAQAATAPDAQYLLPGGVAVEA